MSPSLRPLPWLIFVSLCLLIGTVSAIPIAWGDWKQYSYQVTRVLDGDTVEASDGNINFRIRLAAIDAPERNQPFGKTATLQLQKLIGKHRIQIEPIGKGRDPYNRVVGNIYVDGQEIGLLLVRQGLATYYRPRCRDFPANPKSYHYDPRPYVTAEQTARAQKLKMWSHQDATLPCQWRHDHRKK